MKKITLSNLINLTEEDIRGIKPCSNYNIKIINKEDWQCISNPLNYKDLNPFRIKQF